jgi:hypothetical protein
MCDSWTQTAWERKHRSEGSHQRLQRSSRENDQTVDKLKQIIWFRLCVLLWIPIFSLLSL